MIIHDKDGDINYHAWFEMYKDYLPGKFQTMIEKNKSSLYFLFHVYRKVMRDLEPALQKLIYRQYPVFKKETRPLIVEEIQAITSTTGSSLLFNLYHLLDDQRNGVNVRKKYTEFEEWKQFYAMPKVPDVLDESTRPQYTWLSDEEWVKHVESENKAFLEFFNWCEKRKKEFMDVVQTILFKYYKELENLNGDEWIIYAVHIRDEYEYYLSNSESLEEFIDCGFPEEDIKLSHDEYFERYRQLSPEVRKHSSELRKRRISGENI